MWMGCAMPGGRAIGDRRALATRPMRRSNMAAWRSGCAMRATRATMQCGSAWPSAQWPSISKIRAGWFHTCSIWPTRRTSYSSEAQSERAQSEEHYTCPDALHSDRTGSISLLIAVEAAGTVSNADIQKAFAPRTQERRRRSLPFVLRLPSRLLRLGQLAQGAVQPL